MSSSSAAMLLPFMAARVLSQILNSAETTVANCTVLPVRRAVRPSRL